jgi:hypothetical protein
MHRPVILSEAEDLLPACATANSTRSLYYALAFEAGSSQPGTGI